MQTERSGGLAAASAGRADDGPGRVRRRIEVSKLRASQLVEYARRRAATGADVHVERRGDRTFLVTAE